MALINCPDCGREVSNRAPACIHCGCPLAVEDDSNELIVVEHEPLVESPPEPLLESPPEPTWIIGSEWSGDVREIVRCLDCKLDVDFPFGQERHSTHRIVIGGSAECPQSQPRKPTADTKAKPRTSESSSPGLPSGASTVELQLIRARQDAQARNDPVGAAKRAHTERKEYARRLQADGRYTFRQLDEFLRASEAELERDLEQAPPSSPSASIYLQRVAAIALILLGALYVVYVASLELEASTWYGGVDVPRFLVATLISLALSAAWILPIGVWWLWKTYR